MKKFYSYCLAALSMAAMLFAVGCTDPKPEVIPEVPDPPKPPVVAVMPTISLEVDEEAATATTASVLVTVTNADKFKYTYYVADARPKDEDIEWTEQRVTALDDEYAVDITELPTPDAKYTFEAIASRRDTVSEAKTIDFKTTPVPIEPIDSPVEVADLKAGHNMISFTGTFDEEKCDGYFFAITPAADYDQAKFIEGCTMHESGMLVNQVVKENDTRIKNFNSKIPDLNTEYVVALVGAKLTENGVLIETVGDVRELKITTPPSAQIGSVDDAVTFEITNLTTIKAAVKYERAAGSKTEGFYKGFVLASEVGDKPIDQFAAEWLLSEKVNPWGGESPLQISLPDVFFGGDVYEWDESELKEGTKYVAFAIAYNEFGMLGKVVSKEFTTKSVVFVDTKGVALTATPGITDCKIDFAYEAGFNRSYYLTGAKGDYTLEQAKEDLLRNAADGQNEIAEGETSLTITDLSSGQERCVYVLPVNQDGAFGQVELLEFTTETPVFDGTSTVAITLTKKELNPDYGTYNYELGFTYTSTATSCHYVIVTADDAKDKTAQQIFEAIYAGTMWGSIREASNPTEIVSFGSWDNGNFIVALPYDADGKLGVASKTEITGVPAPPAPEDPGTPGEPGVMRRR